MSNCIDNKSREPELFLLQEQWQILSVEGNDALRFLQGQSTCDVGSIDDGQSTRGAFCNAQGRVIAMFLLFRRDAQHFHLFLRSELFPNIQQRLHRYILRSAVSLPIAQDRILLGLWGDQAATQSLLTQHELELPNAANGVCHCLHGSTLCVSSMTGKRYLLWLNSESAKRLQADPAFKPGNPQEWSRHDITCGIPEITLSTSEEFLPQFLNLDQLHGISFQKGCYTGQEIVARTHYLGKIKHRLFRATSTGNFIPSPGTPVFDRDSGERRGTVLSACSIPGSDQYELLAVLAVANIQKSALAIAHPTGVLMNLSSLPYAVESKTTVSSLSSPD